MLCVRGANCLEGAFRLHDADAGSAAARTVHSGSMCTVQNLPRIDLPFAVLVPLYQHGCLAHQQPAMHPS